jgi:hypothetical protein
MRLVVEADDDEDAVRVLHEALGAAEALRSTGTAVSNSRFWPGGGTLQTRWRHANTVPTDAAGAAGAC